MTRLQLRLQALLEQIDPWLDACFPLATALVCAKQQLIAYSVLTIWISLRLLQHSEKQGWRWILLTLLAINAGLIIADRDLKPGGASDYLIVVLSFSAGIQRDSRHWERSLTWLASSSIPLLIFSLAAGDQAVQFNSSFIGFNANRTGFLAGLLSTLAFCLTKSANEWRKKLLGGFLFSCGITAALTTQSRAAVAVPVITILIDTARYVNWNRRSTWLAIATATLAFALSVRTWYFNPADKYTYGADVNRIATVECWTRKTASKPQSLILGLGYNKKAKNSCGPDQLESIRDRDTPLSHSHNFYVQLFSETGLIGLAACAALTVAAVKRGKFLSGSRTLDFTQSIITYLFLMAIVSTWHSLMLNQVLIGYCLSALSATAPEKEEAKGTTRPQLEVAN